jgi:hypothetical protein
MTCPPKLVTETSPKQESSAKAEADSGKLGACQIYRKAVTGRAVRPGPPEPRVKALRNPGFRIGNQ